MSKKIPTDLHKSCAHDWKTMLDSYENKLYEKAYKSADNILKKCPNHIDTICIKALSKMQCGHKQEAIDLVKLTLKTNMKNAKCWRTLGQLHSYDAQYDQAISCYKFSLKIDPKSVEVMKDLSEIQIYQRDLPGYQETRLNLFNENAGTPSNWMAYATSSYLNGDPELALKIITTYIDNNLLTNKNLKPLSKNRIICFKLRLLEETGRVNEIFQFLAKNIIFVTDKVYINELTYRVATKLGQTDKAKDAIKYLLERNTENNTYHQQYLTSHGLLGEDGVAKDENVEKILEVYRDLKKKFPRSFSISRLPLTYAKGDQFKQLFVDFLHPNLVKGVPSLFNSVKQLYKDQEKVKIMSEIVTQTVESVEQNNSFPNETEKLPITTSLWVWIYASRHFDQLGDLHKAFQYIDKAIEHTPTLEDLYFIKSKFAKHAGDLETAHRLVEKAKSIDIGDRFMNTKASKYGFRAGNFEAAEKTALHFSKEQGQSNLSGMQAHWYFKEAGMCFYNKKDYNKALEMFKIATKHYTEYRNDEFDFHGFNHRICSLSKEVDMVQSTDNYFKHPDYFISATKMIEIYLYFVDNKNEYKPSSDNKDDKKTDEKKVDEDHFAEAVKLSQSLEKNNSHRLETHLLAFQINWRKKKFLLALRSLKSAYAIAPEDPRVRLLKVQYYSQIFSQGLNETLTTVVKKESDELSGLNKLSLQQFVDSLPTNSTSDRLCVARCLFTLDKKAHLERIGKLFVADERPSGLSTCVDAYNFLVEIALNDVAQKFKTNCSSSFPFSTFFGTQKIATVQEDIHDEAYRESERRDTPTENTEVKTEEKTEEKKEEEKK